MHARPDSNQETRPCRFKSKRADGQSDQDGTNGLLTKPVRRSRRSV